MRVIGFNFKKLKIERKGKLKGKIEIKSNLEVESVEKDNVEISSKDALKFTFKYTLTYEPDFADIELNGFILALVEKDELKIILKDWKKKKLPEKIRIPLFNLILDKCNLRALQLEEEFSLPIHLPLPKLTSQQKPEDTAYTG